MGEEEVEAWKVMRSRGDRDGIGGKVPNRDPSLPRRSGFLFVFFFFFYYSSLPRSDLALHES